MKLGYCLGLIMLTLLTKVNGDEDLFWNFQSTRWNLVWEDNFEGVDGSKPKASNWEILDCKRRNNPDGPDGYWCSDDAYIEDNKLVLRVRKREDNNFSSGAIRTKGIHEWLYGRFEIKCKLPTEQGWWVAFWMMQGNVGSVGNGGVDGSEVDILEAFGWNNIINHAIHWDGYGDSHQSTEKRDDVKGIHDGYHTYAMEWSPKEYIFFIDNVEVWRTAGEEGTCNQPGYVKITGECSTLNWATNSRWALDPRQANYPDYFYVDWVKVYQLSDK